jgi:hypothetical protein
MPTIVKRPMPRNIAVPTTLLETDGPANRDIMELGRDATIPPKMMIETPFPIPNSVMSSPIQTSSMVPAVIVSKVAIVGKTVLELPNPKPSINGRPSGPVCCENKTP